MKFIKCPKCGREWEVAYEDEWVTYWGCRCGHDFTMRPYRIEKIGKGGG